MLSVNYFLNVEKLRQSLDKFITVMNHEKLNEIVGNIIALTECLEKINNFEEKGLLNKLSTIFK